MTSLGGREGQWCQCPAGSPGRVATQAEQAGQAEAPGRNVRPVMELRQVGNVCNVLAWKGGWRGQQ